MKPQNINIEILKQIRKLNREEEIRLYGKQISFRPLMTTNKKKYNRKNLKNFQWKINFSKRFSILYCKQKTKRSLTN